MKDLARHREGAFHLDLAGADVGVEHERRCGAPSSRITVESTLWPFWSSPSTLLSPQPTWLSTRTDTPAGTITRSWPIPRCASTSVSPAGRETPAEIDLEVADPEPVVVPEARCRAGSEAAVSDRRRSGGR